MGPLRVTEVIFTTVHGSHLYGMATPQSDRDVFIVTTSTSTHATHKTYPSGVDVCRVGLDTYLRRIFEGSHQSVEALFSPFKVWGDSAHAEMMKPYLAGMRITGRAVFEKYERTIRKFCFGDFKRRRHAARLTLNLADLRLEGRFSPVMTEFEKQYANTLAEYEGEELWKRLIG